MSTTPSTVPNALQAALEERRQKNCLRKLRRMTPVDAVEIEFEGARLTNFSSNDYLGLSKHPFLIERSVEFTRLHGVGSGAARLISGNNELYESLEERLAKLKGTEAALIFSTGFQLNFSVLQALSQLTGAILCDRLSHASLLLGAQASGARFTRFAHNDLNDLSERFARLPGHDKQTYVVTESVFGMDGDFAPLAALEALSLKQGFALFVDEAHATGVFGENGMGLTDTGFKAAIKMGTFSKGCGSFGAYVACSQEMKDYLINFCPGFIYTTALPPAVLGSIDAALTLIPEMSSERAHLKAMSKFVRSELTQMGFDLANSQSQIIPLVVGDEIEAEELSKFLFAQGIFALPIKPPTVPEGSARVRLSLTAAHLDEHVDKLLAAMRAWREKSN